jgi:hypothetical protein
MPCPLLWILGEFWGETTGPAQYNFTNHFTIFRKKKKNHFTISNRFIVVVAWYIWLVKYLLKMCHLQAMNGDAFPLKVPQLELHGSSHVYYLQVRNGDLFLSKVAKLVRCWRSHGWQDGLLEKLLTLHNVLEQNM